jgi:hypothetical protein
VHWLKVSGVEVEFGLEGFSISKTTEEGLVGDVE